MLAGLLPGLEVSAAAQDRPGDSGFVDPAKPADWEDEVTVRPELTGVPGGQGSDVLVGLVDRRTVRSDVVPDPRVTALEDLGFVSDDGTVFDTPAPYEGPEGFIAGESHWDESASTDLIHVFWNPDGSMTVKHTTEPTTVDPEDGFSLVAKADPVLEAVSRGADGFAAEAGDDVEILVPAESAADGTVAELVTPSGAISLRPGRIDLPVDEEASIEDLSSDPSAADGSDGKPADADDVESDRPIDDKPIEEPPTEATPGSEPDPTVRPGQAETVGREVPERPGVVRFDDVVDGVDVEVVATSGGVKLNYIVESYEEASGLVETIELPDGWTVQQVRGFVEILDEKGERAALWTGGPAFDATGKLDEFGNPPAFVSLELVEVTDSSATARLVVDDKWLGSPDTVYPIVLDPAIDTYSGVVQDTWIGDEDPSASIPTTGELRVGTENGGANERYTLVEFGLIFDDEISVGPPIQSANLFLTPSYTGGCSTQWLNVRRATNAWDEVSVEWASQPGSAYHQEGDVQFSNCSQSQFGVPVDSMVQHWMDNPGSNHGFLIHKAPGSPYRSFYSSDWNGPNTLVRPVLEVTYDVPQYLAQITPLAEFDNGVTTPQTFEITLPIPSGTSNQAEYGRFPLWLQNQGNTDWNSGSNPEDNPPPTANTIRVAYHVRAGTSGAWDQFEGLRTQLPVGSSNMFDYYLNLPAGTAPAPDPNEFVMANIRNSDYSTPGVRQVYFTMIHEGEAWYDLSGSPLAEAEPIRWTEPPTLVGPAQGSVFSTLEDVTFDWSQPYDGQSEAWNPQEYRLRVYDGGLNIVHESSLSGTSETVPAATLGTGALSWTVEARDIANESSGDPARYTHAAGSALVITGIQLGNDPMAENFAGVNPANGNFYTAVTDISIPSVSGELEVTRHFNSQSLTAGIFGPGITTKYDTSFHCVTFECDATSGDRILVRADASLLRFVAQGDGTFKASDGSDVTATRIETGQVSVRFEIEYPDGRLDHFTGHGTGTFEEFGDYAGSTSAEGHRLLVSSSPANGFPIQAVDVASGRTLTFDQVFTGGAGPSAYRISRISIGNTGTPTEFEEVTYDYYANWSFEAANNQLGFLTGASWRADGRLEQLKWASNLRETNLTYNLDGTILSVVNGRLDTTSFDYDFANNYTTITDGNGHDWKAHFDSRNRTTMLEPPSGSATSYAYVDNFRTGITRELNATETANSTLVYGVDEQNKYSLGHLLQQTNGEGETTYYRYEAGNYGSDEHVTGPSHVCDARSQSAADGTYCTEFKYDALGNKIFERQPGETEAEAEEWSYTTGNETVSGGTMPPGLLHRYSDGNIAAGAEGVQGYEYDVDGNLVEIEDIDGLVTTFTHDALGRVLTETIEYTNESNASVTELVATHRYDAAGRIQFTTGPSITNTAADPNISHQYEVEYVRDQNGLVDSMIERDLASNDSTRTWTYLHDAMDRVVVTKDPENQGGTGYVVEFDDNGNQTSTTDPEGNEVETLFNNRNLPTITRAVGFDDGHSGTANTTRTLVDRDYDAGGRLIQVQTFLSATDSYTETIDYDRADRQTSITRTEDGQTTIVSESIYVNGFMKVSKTGAVTQPGSLTEPSTENVRVTSYDYDLDGRIEARTVAGRETAYTYDPVGNELTVTMTGLDGYSGQTTTHTVTNEYDSGSNLERTVVENGAVDLESTYDYDERGLLIEQVDPGQNLTEHVYDVLGRLVRTERPAVPWEAATSLTNVTSNWGNETSQPVIEFGHNSFGDQTHLADPNGNLTATSFDRNGRRTRVDHPQATQPDGTAAPTAYEAWTYDNNGNTESYRSRNGNATNFEFDGANRSTIQTDPLLDHATGAPEASRGETQTFYDFLGRPTEIIDPTGAATSTTYDNRGFVETTTAAVRAVPGQPALTDSIAGTNSALGFTIGTLDSVGNESSAEYNTFGEMLSETVGSGALALNSTAYLYDGVGRVRQVTTPSGESFVTNYDPAGRAIENIELTSADAVIRSTSQGYDGNGNIETSTSGRGAATVYVYDSNDRLTSVVTPVEGTTTITTSHGYDLNGNPTRFTDGNGNLTRTVYNEWDLPTVVIEPSAPTSTTENERRFTTEYNAGGQPIREEQPGSRVRTVEYNSLALPDDETLTHPSQTNVARTVRYDLAGRVVEASHPTAPINYSYDDRGLLVTQTGGAGAMTTEHDAAGRPVEQTDEAGTRRYEYENSTGLLDSIEDFAAGGTGGISGSLDIMMIVGQAPGLYSNEQAIYDHLVSEGHTVTLRDNQEPETTDPNTIGDLIVIAHGGYLGNKYEDAAVPTINFAAFRWDDHELTIGNNAGQTNTATIDITNPAHPMAAGNSGITTVLNTSRNIQYVTSSQFGTSPPDVVATTGVADQIVLIGYEKDALLTDGTLATEARVGLSIFGATNTSPTADGLGILDAAIAWTGAGGGSTNGGGTSAWSETYDYDNFGRLETTTYGGGGVRTIGYDDAGRMESDIVSDGVVNTVETTYVYSCDHELIEKNIIELGTNTGADRNTYTYDHAGRLTSWNDAATTTPDLCPGAGAGGGGGGGGGGSGSATLDILLLVNNPASLQNTEQRINDEFVADGHNVTLRDAGDPEISWTGVIVVADTGGLGSKYANAATPIVDLIPWHFDNLGMTTADHNAVAWEDEMTIVEPTHPLAAGNTGTTQVLQSSHGMAYHDSTKFGVGSPELVADLASTPGWRVLMGYTDQQTLADGSTAPEARVGISGFHGSNANPTTAGYDMLEAALQWANDPNSGTGGGSPGGWTPSGDLYTYDDAGNRLTAGTETFTYDDRNRLSSDSDGSYSWNDDGTLDTYTPNTGPAENYTFDAAGRLTDITAGTSATDYAYDGLDRIAERDGEAFTYNGSQWDPTSDGMDMFHRTSGGSLVAYEDPSGVNHVVDNNHFDLTALVEPDGSLSDTATYDPWGDPIATTGGTNPVLGYQSDYTDPDTGHVWMGTRWYQPTTGTFLSRDTYAGELSTPFTLNRYTYATNNPLNLWDPDGRCSGSLKSSVDGLGCGDKFADQSAAAANIPDGVIQAEGDGFDPYPNYNTGTVTSSPPPQPVPPGIPVTFEAFVAALNNIQIVDPVWQQAAWQSETDTKASIANSFAVGDTAQCDNATNATFLTYCDEVRTAIDVLLAAGVIEYDPNSASEGALRTTSCGNAGCHLWDPLGDLIAPGNSADNFGFLIGLSGLETAGNFAIWGSLPKGSSAPHHLSWQPTMRERFTARANQIRQWFGNSGGSERGASSFGSGAGRHTARVWVTGSSGNRQFTLHSGDMTAEESALGFPRNSLATHTEARAMRQLEGQLNPGDRVTIRGTLEPCTSCRGAMNRTGRSTGAIIEYRWPGGTWRAQN